MLKFKHDKVIAFIEEEEEEEEDGVMLMPPWPAAAGMCT